jgi:hypothetical protein
MIIKTIEGSDYELPDDILNKWFTTASYLPSSKEEWENIAYRQYIFHYNLQPINKKEIFDGTL